MLRYIISPFCRMNINYLLSLHQNLMMLQIENLSDRRLVQEYWADVSYNLSYCCSRSFCIEISKDNETSLIPNIFLWCKLMFFFQCKIWFFCRCQLFWNVLYQLMLSYQKINGCLLFGEFRLLFILSWQGYLPQPQTLWET